MVENQREEEEEEEEEKEVPGREQQKTKKKRKAKKDQRQSEGVKRPKIPLQTHQHQEPGQIQPVSEERNARRSSGEGCGREAIDECLSKDRGLQQQQQRQQ